MRQPQIYFTDWEFVTCTRSNCGIVFAVPAKWFAERVQDHKVFYCPKGHDLECCGVTKADLEKARADDLANQLAAANKTCTAFKGHLTRLRKGGT